MKRSLMFLSALVLLSCTAMAVPNDWGSNDKHKTHDHAVPELGVAPMLVVSFATLAGGLALKRRQGAKTVA
jgi:hypothetical protein